MHRMRPLFVLMIAAAALAAFAAFAATTSPAPAKAASAIPPEVQHGIAQFNAEAIKAHVRFLSSDLLEGRGPGTRGDDTAMQYIAAQFEAPASASEHDLFKGKARTYYGRWTYKYEMGAAKNADAVILIHTNEAAGYGWQVVSNSWGGENSFMKLKPGQSDLKFAGWVTKDVARELFQKAGLDLDALTKAAASRDFKPVDLGVKFSGSIASKIRTFDTGNVVGK